MDGTVDVQFIHHFGEMGARWGLKRTVAQIYALLLISAGPLCADQIVAKLGVSRSNVSMSLKELQDWRLVEIHREPGDRREYFTTPEDNWAILRTLVTERKKREIDPLLDKLRELESVGEGDAYAQNRIHEMRALIEKFSGFYAELDRLETSQLEQLMEMGGKLRKIVTVSEKILPLNRRGRA